ncbi:uracil permease [candidate division MSBL1 archaeon SCGC-AAA259I09]|uniref:Uracil permease n=1 Tax=candidate division MSBL1 archaeon SCGC-AAA259I09 TaxID=1698267 RepID=A0A133USZ3_9EURY|nr:uracil permease [candidate division MSBL1 archaeon SCGC-AAA259I09]
MGSSSQGEESIVAYEIDEKPPLGESIPLGVQHVLAMFLGNVAPPLIIAGALGLATGTTSFLVQMALFVAGVATIVQAYPIGPVGARLPIVMGTSFAFLGPLIGIGSDYGLATVFGACLVGASVEIGLGAGLRKRFKKIFPPIVSGIVVMLIGLTLIPVGMDYVAGGVGAANYGYPINLGLAGLVFLISLVLNQYFDGILRYASILIGIVVGYIVAIPLGMVDFSAIEQASWFAIPIPLKFGINFKIGPIITLAFLYVITTMETIGDITGTTSAVGREPDDRELSGGLIADGVMSSFGAIFNALPNTSFSQNVGLINFTGVASRFAAAIGGVFLVGLGLIPKIGAIVAEMPDAVLGGGALIMFGMIFSSGARIIINKVKPGRRNMVILAVAIGLGLAVELRPDAIETFFGQLQPTIGPIAQDAQTFFSSGLITGGFSGLVLSFLLPEG